MIDTSMLTNIQLAVGVLLFLVVLFIVAKVKDVQIAALLGMVVVLIAAGTMSYLMVNGIVQPDTIPDHALVGADAKTAHLIGHYKIDRWATGVHPSARFTIFEVTTTGSPGMREYRVLYGDSDRSIYVGALSEQFGIRGLQTLLIDLGVERCIIGRVSPTIPGRLRYVYFEPFNADPIRMLDMRASSEIDDNFFIRPLTENIPEWDRLGMVAVQTEESLRDRPNGKGSVADAVFDGGLDVSDLFARINIQD